jgi:ParB family chromosome partitioning protein
VSGVLEVTPPGTQAAMITAVLADPHPRIALPSIASRFNTTLADLQTVLNNAGYPHVDQMRTAATRLRAQAVEQADQDLTDTAETPQDSASHADGNRLRRVAVSDLHPDPDNLREHVHGVPSIDPLNTSGRDTPADDIEQLADSIREVGLLQPIVARRADDGRLVIVAGHRRLAAVQRLQWTHVDVVIRPPMRPDHVIAAMLIENGQRRDLDPIEEARGIRRLKEQHQLTDAKVARKIGRSQRYVSDRLALLELTPDQQDQIRSGEMSKTHAAGLSRLQSGKTKNSSKGHISVPYFGPTNDLASRAQARCKRLAHKLKLAGGVACGGCWESVIRADERAHLQTANAKADDCVTCGHPIDRNRSNH